MNLAAIAVMDTIRETERLGILKGVVERLHMFSPKTLTRTAPGQLEEPVLRTRAEAVIAAAEAAGVVEDDDLGQAIKELEVALAHGPLHWTSTEVDWLASIDAFAKQLQQDVVSA